MVPLIIGGARLAASRGARRATAGRLASRAGRGASRAARSRVAARGLTRLARGTLGSVRFEWNDELTPGIAAAGPKVRAAARATAERMAPEVEAYMKNNAPWRDQTSNARNGLAARGYEEGDEVGIVLYHQVPYGIYLETRWSGRYAIINPTIDAMGPVVMEKFDRLLDRL